MALAFLPTSLEPSTDFDPYVWDPDQWLTGRLRDNVCRELLEKLREVLDAYWDVAAPDRVRDPAQIADDLVLALLGLVTEERVESPARGFHLLQCLGAQLYSLDSGRQRLDPLLYWTNLCRKSQRLLENANAESLGGRLHQVVETWLTGLGIDVAEEDSVAQTIYRLTVPHLKRADILFRQAMRKTSRTS